MEESGSTEKFYPDCLTSACEENIKSNIKIDLEKVHNCGTANNQKQEEKEINKSVKCVYTEIKIETEKVPEIVEEITKGNKPNPMITISKPVNSPSEMECDGMGDVGGGRGAEEKPSREQRGRCPIYYGIKSYIHDFYYPLDKDVLNNGDYIQEDNFQYLVDPEASCEQGRGWSRGQWWLRPWLWAGVNLILVGIIALAVGHLTPPRPPVVHQEGELTVLDRWAVAYNNRLLICQMIGLAVFTAGVVVVFMILLLSIYHRAQAPAYCVLAATVVPETFVASPMASTMQDCSHRIPLTGTIRGVQPTLPLACER